MTAVDWAQFFPGNPHPPDIDGTLAGLTSPDSGYREACSHGLHEVFRYHPAVIPHVVPALLALVPATLGSIREPVLGLILTATAGLNPPDPDREPSYDPTPYPGLADAIRAAVDCGRPLYRQLLADYDPVARALAADLVAATGDAEALPAVRTQLARERLPRPFVHLLGALAKLAPAEARPLAEKALECDDPLVLLHGAAILGEVTRPVIPSTVGIALADLVVAWWGTDWVQMCVLATLSRLGDKVTGDALSVLLPRLAKPPGNLERWVTFLLRLVFRNQAPFPTPLGPAEITLNRRRVLRALAAADAVWNLPAAPQGMAFVRDVYWSFEESGLPTTRAELVAFLGRVDTLLPQEEPEKKGAGGDERLDSAEARGRTMDEEEWLATSNPTAMLEDVELTDERKLRLFTVACCRRVWSHLPSDEDRAAVEVAERFADGAATPRELARACKNAEPSGRPRSDAAVAGWYAARQEADTTGCVLSASLIHANSVVPPARRAADQERWDEADSAESAAQADLLRDIFGNPFRPVVFSPEWCSSTVVALAAQMYESRDFAAMPILADALQDAGCDSDEILHHLRDSNATHVRGCWVVDLILGKS